MQKKKDFLINFFYTGIIITICFFAIKYLLGPLSPFITAFIIVSFSRKIISILENATHSKKYSSILFTFILVITLSTIVYGIFYGLFTELTSLSRSFSEDSISELFNNISDRAKDMLSFFSSFDVLSNFSSFITSKMENFDETIIKSLSSFIPSAVSFTMKFLSFFPSAVVFLCFMFISVYYISYDYDRICSFLKLQMPERVLETFDETMQVITSTAKELFKSYFLLTLITFFQLLVGFLTIGIDYSLLLASIICFIDLIPVLGTGTVLIPWAIICFIIGDYSTAIGLIVLYASIMIFRQIAEPKIIGTNTGLSPLLSLISVFLGLKLIGFSGVIIFPILTITVISLNQKGFIKLYKNYPENNKDKIKKSRLKFLNFKQNDRFR